MPVKSENDRFYGSIARYYASAFPLNPEQAGFMERELGSLADRAVLDVGCATGVTALELARRGAMVTAIDLNGALLEEARSHRSHERILYRKANMLHIARLFGRSKFDAVVCFGNTLVHLMNPMQMRDFFSSSLTVLKPGGLFFLQILNYDYLLGEKISTLPAISNETVSLERKYLYPEGSREIRFKTRWTVHETGEVFDNEIDLLGIGSEDLRQLMDIAGLKDIRLFADYRGTPAGGKHLPLVALAAKGHEKPNMPGIKPQ